MDVLVRSERGNLPRFAYIRRGDTGRIDQMIKPRSIKVRLHSPRHGQGTRHYCRECGRVMKKSSQQLGYIGQALYTCTKGHTKIGKR